MHLHLILMQMHISPLQPENKNCMKKLIFLIPAIALIASCTCSGFEKVRGNGNLITQSRTVKPVSKIDMSGSIDVELIQGNEFKVEVSADENLQNYIITKVQDGELHIHYKSGVNISTDNPVKVYVTMNELKSIEASGSGDVSCNGKFTNNSSVNIDISGSGNINLMVHTPEVKVDIAGSADVAIVGETRDLKVDVAGSGSFKGGELKAENAKVDVNGSGDALIFADQRLDAAVHGSGTITYAGKADVRSEVSGSGTIKKRI